MTIKRSLKLRNFLAPIAILSLATIVFGGSTNVFADARDVSEKFTATAEIISINDIKISAKGTLDGVKDGDYMDFQFENAFVQAFDKTPVIYKGEEIGITEVVGEYFIDKTRLGTVDESIVPSVSKGYIRLTFNKNVEKYLDTEFSLETQSSVSYMAVDKDWVAHTTVSFKDQVLAEKDTNVPKRTIYGVGAPSKTVNSGPLYYNYNTKESLFNLNLENDNWQPFTAGHKIKVVLGDTAEIRFKPTAETKEMAAAVTPYYAYATTPKNANGVYFPNEKDTLKVRVLPVTENTIEVEILETAPKKDLLFVLELRDIIELVNSEKAQETKIRIQDIEYETYINNKKQSIREDRVKGANLNISRSKVETNVVREKSNEVNVAKDEVATASRDKILVPDTGFKSNDGSLQLVILTTVGLFTSIFTFFVAKKL